MNRNRRRNLGDIPQNLRPEHITRAQEIPFAEEQPLKRFKQTSTPPLPAILPIAGKPKNIALRGRFSSQAINVTDKSKQVLNSSPKRVYFIVQNNGINDVFINFGNKAGIGNLRIIPDGNYDPIVCPTDSISLVCNTGQSSACTVVEAVEVNE